MMKLRQLLVAVLNRELTAPVHLFRLVKARCLSSRSGGATVMSFGDGSQGALGLPYSQVGFGMDAYEPTSVLGLPSNVASVSAGHYHSLAITSDGQLWAWGRNSEGQLGRGLSLRDSWNEPQRVLGLEEVKVSAAFASGVVSAALGEDGSLWVWGKSKRGQLGLGKGVMEAAVPSQVEALSGENIVKVSFGWGHALALTEDGKLFGWGYLADGRIGNVGELLEASPLDSIQGSFEGNQQLSGSTLQVAEKRVLEEIKKEKHMPISWNPCQVEELQGMGAVDIACGLDHSLVLCSDGTLLSGGSNIYGQLGRLRQDLGMFPVDINICPLSIACGLGHSLAVCVDSVSDVDGRTTNLMSWGWNQSFQLGRTGPENLPSIVLGLIGENPTAVSGGRAHSIALTSRAEAWVWGSGKNGRLGLGSSENEAEPILLDSLEGLQVLQVVSGFDHCLVLISE